MYAPLTRTPFGSFLVFAALKWSFAAALPDSGSSSFSLNFVFTFTVPRSMVVSVGAGSRPGSRLGVGARVGSRNRCSGPARYRPR